MNKKQTTFKQTDSRNAYNKTNSTSQFEGLFQLFDDEIVNKRITGKEIDEASPETNDPYPFKKPSANYFLLLAGRNKITLLKKKNGANK